MLEIIWKLISEYRVVSITAGVLSALYWLYSAFVKSKEKPQSVTLTFDKGTENVDLHNFILTARLQAKYNSRAACFAALCAIFQVFGL
ncbi:hypothetical protein AB8970_04240 [Yersinia enterocolitica]|uniref:hypothetical protein n=1 Tax=Yersinia enterocolitica TaxID=630 RepID=UPI003D019343